MWTRLLLLRNVAQGCDCAVLNAVGSIHIAVYCMSCALQFSEGLTCCECLAEMVTQPALPSHYFSLCLQRKGKLLCCICSCSTDRTDTWYLQDGVWPFCFRYALYCVRAVGLAFSTPSQWLPPPLSGAVCSIWSVQPIAKHLQKQGCCWYCHKSARSPCVKIQ